MGPLEALQVSATLGLLKSARFHQLRAPHKCQVSPTLRPRKLQVSPTLGPSQAAGFTSFGKRSRFQLLWASSRVPGFTNFGPLARARFHLLCAPRKRQVSPTVAPSQAAGFTSFGPLGSGPGFSYFGPPQECQVSPTSGHSRLPGFTYFQVSPILSPSQAAGSTSFGPLGSAPGFTYFGPPQECQVSPISGPSRVRSFIALGPSQTPSFAYCSPLASCRLHLFWTPWKRSRFQLLWAFSRVPGFTNFGSLAIARFRLLSSFTYFKPLASCRLLFWAPWKRSRFHLLWASSRVPGFTNFRPLASAIFHCFGPLANSKFRLL